MSIVSDGRSTTRRWQDTDADRRAGDGVRAADPPTDAVTTEEPTAPAPHEPEPPRAEPTATEPVVGPRRRRFLGRRSRRARPLVRPDGRRRLTAGRWFLLFLVLVVLTGAGAYAGREVTDRMPDMYAAQADVMYPLSEEQPTGFLRQDRNLSTQEVLIASPTVLDPVSVAFGIPVEDLQEELDTEVVDESEIIRVRFTDPDGEQARLIVDAIVAQYLLVANNPARTDVRAYLDAQLADVQARLATARLNAESAILGVTQAAQAEINALVQREATLRAQIDEEQLSAIAGPVPRVTVPARIDPERVSPQPLLTIGGGALAGLVVAVIVVAVLARRMTRP